MPDKIIERPSLVRRAEMEGSDLHLTVILYDTVELPPMANPVLELTLHGCSDLDAVRTALPSLRDASVWALEREDSGNGQTVIFADDRQDFLTLQCELISQQRRPFAEAEWHGLCEAYERWVRKEQATGRRIRQVLDALMAGLHQRRDRAERIIAEGRGDSPIAMRARGRLEVVAELENMIYSSLDTGA